MTELVKTIKKKLFSSDEQDDREQKGVDVDDKIALGVLLWEVAEADKKFLPEEKEEIEEILKNYSNITDEDMSIVIRTIEIASLEKIDLYKFTKEVNSGLSYQTKVDIVESLFRVACVDRDLDHSEEEVIRKISGLFKVDHKDFINSKIKVKKEFGLDTAGL